MLRACRPWRGWPVFVAAFPGLTPGATRMPPSGLAREPWSSSTFTASSRRKRPVAHAI